MPNRSMPAELLDEVTALVEWPVVYVELRAGVSVGAARVSAADDAAEPKVLCAERSCGNSRTAFCWCRISTRQTAATQFGRATRA